MSNIGKMKIHIPPSLSILKSNYNLDFYTLKFIGPLGSISINLPELININIDKDSLSVESTNKIMWGTTRNLIQQAITGVTIGYSKKLELIGIGYKFSLSNKILTFYLGKSHPIFIHLPKDDLITINVINSTILTASSISNVYLSTFIHRICQIKPAYKDHYKGKGIQIT
jgi:large subunit ribosomal protein L6